MCILIHDTEKRRGFDVDELSAGGPGSGRKPLYHGTTKDKAEAIMKSGLKVNEGVATVTTEKDYAERAAKLAVEERGGKPAVVVLKDSANKFFDDGMTEYGYSALHNSNRSGRIASRHMDRIEDVEAKAYKLAGKTVFQELPISIETKKGQTRKGIGSDGKPWKVVMPFDYGYIRGTEGADGQHVDCFIGPNEEAENVYVIHQHKEDDEDQYDEDKVMLGFDSPEEAKKAYKSAYNHVDLFKGMHTFNMEDFQEAIAKKSNRGKALEAGSIMELLVQAQAEHLLAGKDRTHCPICGSRKYVLMPPDFETAKCKNCGKTWDTAPVKSLADLGDVEGGGPGSGVYEHQKRGGKQYVPHPRQKQAQPAPKGGQPAQPQSPTSISKKGKVVDTKRQQAALKNPKRTAMKEQQLAEGVIQQLVAKAIGGKVWGNDSETMDVLTNGNENADLAALLKLKGRRGLHGIEVKGVISQQASARELAGQLPQVSMKKSAVRLKEAWSREHQAPIHTVIVDVRQSLKNPTVYHKYGVGNPTFAPDPKDEERAGAKRVPGGLKGLRALIFAKKGQVRFSAEIDYSFDILSQGAMRYENVSVGIGNDDDVDVNVSPEFSIY